MNGEQTRKYPETIQSDVGLGPWYVYDLGDTQKLGSPNRLTDEQVEREIELFGQAESTPVRVVDRPEVFEPDDTVPVERLAKWLHWEFGETECTWSDVADQEGWRATARDLMSQLPELFR